MRRDDDTRIHWERVGTVGKPKALFLHGGPGSGSGKRYRSFFDQTKWDLVTLDQRGSGRSLPLVSDDLSSLARNTTQTLIEDIEALRELLSVDRWLIVGLSWGATLALAYAEAHPDRTNGMVLGAVTTTSRSEVEWITQDLKRVFPREWKALADVARARPGERIIDALYRGIVDLDVRRRAEVANAWGKWENTHVSLSLPPDSRWNDPQLRLNLATLILHYWSHHAFLDDHGIMDNLGRIGGIPIDLVHGRLDVSSTLSVPWEINQRLPLSRLIVIEDEGHAGQKLFQEVKAAVSRFSDSRFTGDAG
jgi:proline iminopeptidase